MVLPNISKAKYWENFEATDEDIEFLYNKLFELETPLKTNDLVKLLIKERIRIEKEKIEKINSLKDDIYLPKDDYEVGQRISFPAFNPSQGKVIAKRPGNNPQLGSFSVLEIEFLNGEKKLFASSLAHHELNDTIISPEDDSAFDFDNTFTTYRRSIANALTAQLENNEDLVQIAGYWFPRSLLVDIGAGYLNLAEAVLEVADGGPLTTQSILGQIDLPSDSNPVLTEFSLNYALQEDQRFDEVGIAGETLWFLHRLEPEFVRSVPEYLKSEPHADYDSSYYKAKLAQINADVFDDLETEDDVEECFSEVTVGIIYPHWRAGTLPLSNCLESLFPTAYEAPRIRFTFIDSETGERFPGWVIRQYRYVYGLIDWYKKNDVVPGSLIHIKQGKIPGEVSLSIGKKRPTREWVRTGSTDAEGKITFKMLKQLISTEFDERMIIVIPEPDEFDQLWKKYKDYPLLKLVPIIFRELAKLNPQGRVHAKELYSAINCVRRISPSHTLHLLETIDEIEHLGDMYFRIKI
ncbi:MAG: hypothetical protein BGO78_01595 [Chloroflexi bacterium 44-23]|nr:MAG: hypothetical protein BGO78_01595 [Chloroflexi bacterium 44-23]